MKIKDIRCTWTNWTFGIWWGTISRNNLIGLDIGPFEVVWIRGK